ncbi:hypothetical protein BS78_04G233200 [Paspalum vaginatum]|nr:hypothetical protein BS78_04G233200 [Paspalum vaginatum]
MWQDTSRGKCRAPEAFDANRCKAEGLKCSVPGGAGMVVGGRFVCTRPPHAAEQGRGGEVTWRRSVDVEGWGSGEESTFGLESATRAKGTPPRGRCVNPCGVARQIGWLWRASRA